jgi:transcriptional regulator with XRE-family HTH domain
MLAVTIGQAEIGPKIRKARDKKRWKQKELAAAVHVEPVTISRWETGKNTPDLGMLERIAEALDQPLAYFVTPEAGSQAELDLVETQRQLAAEVARMRELNDEMTARLAERATPQRGRRPA